MSGYILRNCSSSKKYSPYYIDISYIQSKIQEALDNGYDDSEKDIKDTIRYYTEGVAKIDVNYMRSCRFYVIQMKTVDNANREYHYKFFVQSRNGKA